MAKSVFKYILPGACITLACIFPLTSYCQSHADGKEYYQITDVPIPDDIQLEVGGLSFTDDDRLGVATRKGEVWVIEDPYTSDSEQAGYKRYAYGLHEPLGLAFRNGSFYASQRPELTKITDTNQDGRGDLFETIREWPITGNYHEYAYGPLFLPDGDMLVTLNLSWIGRGASLSKWRGWMLKVKENGEIVPYAMGLRSPAGYGLNDEGDIFYAENQGDWIGSGRITQLDKGDFAGHPASLRWSGEPDSPMDLKPESFPDSVGVMHEFAKKHSSLKLPSVWFPHGIMGISTSDILSIDTDNFGPFKGQLLVGDQGHSKIMRVFLEKVNGEYQGASFTFLDGFASGILRMVWGSDHSLFVGMTNRGWSSTGQDLFGLQRVIWNREVPFEIKEIRAQSDGFELEFTHPVDSASASGAEAYSITGFTYSYHRAYGSPVIQQQDSPVVKVEVSNDRKKVRLYTENLREGYIHELKTTGIRSGEGLPLLHSTAYYTLNNIPKGPEPDSSITGTEVRKQQEVPPACGQNRAKNPASQPASWTSGPDVVINISTKPGLKFDLEDIEVAEGSRVKLVFNNDDDMLHNLLIVNPETATSIGEAAMEMGLDGSKLGYIPESDDVLFHTCLLQPESSQSIYFVAPGAGDYDYVCTFPGHHVTMRGKLHVIPDGSSD